MLETVIFVVVLILSIVLHELAHGYAANWLGDPTARLAGRLTLNPIRHIDPLGSIIIPTLLFLTKAPFLFGWAKPVPYNPYNLRNQRWGESFVAAAGPLTNLLIAAIFALMIRFSGILGLPIAFLEIASFIVLINIVLALFNAIPFPPLDGSKVIAPFLPLDLAQKYQVMGRMVERLGFVGLFIVLFLFFNVFAEPFARLVGWVHGVFIGG
jgi:Zn-dependent protease